MLAPTNLKATAANGKVTLTWTAASGADKVRIWRKENVAGAAWVKVTTTGNPTTYTDGGVTAGKTYSYRVKSYSNADGVLSAGYSNIVKITAK